MKDKPTESIAVIIQKDLTARVGEKVKVLAQDLREVKTKFERLSTALEDYEGQKQKSHSILGRLISESMNALGKGGRPKDKEIREAKAELVEIEVWLSKIQEGIPEVQAEVQTASEALKSALREAVGPVKAEWTDRMGKKLDEAMDLYESWISGCNEFYASLGVGLNAASLGEIPTIGRSCPRLDDYFKRVMHFRG